MWQRVAVIGISSELDRKSKTKFSVKRNHFQMHDNVSFVIPHFNNHECLNAVLHRLVQQLEPDDEVIVVDDGSDLAPNYVSDIGCRLLHQERDGFGLSRARNFGADEAVNEWLYFLDCDMLPSDHLRQSIRALLSNPGTGPHAFLGYRVHCSDSDVPTVLSRSLSAHLPTLSDLVADCSISIPGWLWGHYDRTSFLRRGPESWRAMSGGNLLIQSRVWRFLGGNSDQFNSWGGEDNEFAYRFFSAGFTALASPNLLCVHLGDGSMPSAEEVRALTEKKRFMASKIPDLNSPREFDEHDVPKVSIHVLNEESLSGQFPKYLAKTCGCKGFDGVAPTGSTQLNDLFNKLFQTEDFEAPMWKSFLDLGNRHLELAAMPTDHLFILFHDRVDPAEVENALKETKRSEKVRMWSDDVAAVGYLPSQILNQALFELAQNCGT
ncbi:MAG: hypothetical protein CL412_03275 [Acidimicrobiaceae bacterium]|nr:hypothetical protein [Acidimicrobiaceae bacterium]MAN33485.1 hypothetical protein [Acidimicrobiaceae bacterium]